MDVINQGISIASKEEGFHQRSQFMKKLLIGLTTIIVTLPLIAQTTMGSGINPSPSATGSGLGTGVGTGNTSTPDSPVGGRPTTNSSSIEAMTFLQPILNKEWRTITLEGQA